MLRETASPGAATALDLCDSLYLDVLDNLGAARRAIGFKDAVTIRAMMGMAAQDMQGCDEQFKKVGEKNPMDRFDQSLLKMSENCRALSKMI
uniref:Pectinesterase inhibitor domain-containing protein n=1 Tax=Oryza brachyantha TaxID=4533 RepID=J3KYC5_ORYBR